MPEDKEQLIEYTVLRQQDHTDHGREIEVGETVLLTPAVGYRESQAGNVIETALVKTAQAQVPAAAKPAAKTQAKNKNTEVKTDGA